VKPVNSACEAVKESMPTSVASQSAGITYAVRARSSLEEVLSGRPQQ
jgi:hypothetical protein